MKILRLFFTVFVVYGLVFFACSSGGNETADGDSKTETNASNDSDEEKESKGGLNITVDDGKEKVNITLGGDKEVVDFRELKKLMPDKLVGLKRTELEGQKTGMMGFNISTAQASYEEDDKKIDVTINDAAGFEAALVSMAAWANIEMDKETDTGYERTTTIDGQKAFVKYDSEKERGEYSVIVDNRFIVTMKVRNINEKDFNNAFREIGWKSLIK